MNKAKVAVIKLEAFLVKSRYNSKRWVGRTKEGEFVALNSHSAARDIYRPEVVDDQNYVSEVGCWDPEILPLTNSDKTFLESAYVGQIEHCTECYDNAFDANECYEESGFKITEDGYVCPDCFEAYAAEHLDDYINAPSRCITLKSAEALRAKGRLKFIERFIGGMTDGRGGSWGGERCSEGHPIEILKALKAKYPKRNYVFSHDESGQFQTYFSVWQVKSKRGAK